MDNIHSLLASLINDKHNILGFFCPKNVAQPTYCCPGFYCPADPNPAIAPNTETGLGAWGSLVNKIDHYTPLLFFCLTLFFFYHQQL